MDSDLMTTVEILHTFLIWLLLGICLTRILNQSQDLNINRFLVWIPFANLWVLTQIGRVSLWWALWRSFVSAFVVMLIFTFLSAVTGSVSFAVIGLVLSNIVGCYWLFISAIRQGSFQNADQLALMTGVPVIGSLILIHIAWKGDWL